MTTPYPNSYWLIPGKVLCGEYPRDIDDFEDPVAMRSLLEAGTRVFVDLTEEGELKPYREIAETVAGELGIPALDLVFRRHPIRDVSTPGSHEEMKAILTTIRRAMEAGEIAYIHCWGGRGRTGTVGACLLGETGGLEGDRALAALKERWQDCAKSAYSESPETGGQRGFVRSYLAESP